MFIVNTDQEIFEGFKELELKLQSLSVHFQNPKTKITHDELGEWWKSCTKFKEDFDEFIDKCEDKIRVL